ncbi:HNH endonuclease [Serratia sp. IR-2025]
MAINHKAHEIYIDALTIVRDDLVKHKSLIQAKNTFYQLIKNHKIPAENAKHSRVEDILDYFEIHGVLDLQRKLEHLMKAENSKGNVSKSDVFKSKEAKIVTVEKTTSRIKNIASSTSIVINPSGNFKYSGEELRALAAGKSISEMASVIYIDNSVSCVICRKKCNTLSKFNKHYKKRHAPYTARKLEADEEYRLANLALIKADLKKYKDKEEIKEALRKQLAPSPLDESPPYNVEAYRIAIRKMPQGEAYKLAKDVERSKKIIKEFDESLLNTEMLVSLNTMEISNSPSEIAEHYKLNEMGDSLICKGKDKREKRECFTKLNLQEDIEEKAKFSERKVKCRTNQSEFAKRVASNFSYKCCITGSNEPLEAAHIEPLSVGDNNNTSNGLLLIACLHRLLDSGKMAINPESLTVHFSKDCTWFGVPIFDGKSITSPHTPLNTAGLEKLWERFKMDCL